MNLSFVWVYGKTSLFTDTDDLFPELCRSRTTETEMEAPLPDADTTVLLDDHFVLHEHNFRSYVIIRLYVYNDNEHFEGRTQQNQRS